MSVLVLDTNIVSFLMRPALHAPSAELPIARSYRPLIEGHTLAISFMTVAELFEGAYRASWGMVKLGKLESILRNYLVLRSSPAICMAWARVRAERRTQPISVDDAWIAATAVAHACPLVTHNPSDFGGISGLKILTHHT